MYVQQHVTRQSHSGGLERGKATVSKMVAILLCLSLACLAVLIPAKDASADSQTEYWRARAASRMLADIGVSGTDSGTGSEMGRSGLEGTGGESGENGSGKEKVGGGKQARVIPKATQRPNVPVTKQQPKSSGHLDKLAYAIAMAETQNCTVGYGASHNNCFGIKRGGIVPCTTRGFRKMCVFASKEESYAAFKKIWTKGYGGGFPTVAMAAVWTGNDNPHTWLSNVRKFYNS